MIRALCVLLCLATPALAHRLIVFAYAEDGQIVGEAKFGNNRPATVGEVRVESEAEEVLSRAPLGAAGVTRLEVLPEFSAGVVVHVSTEGGHSDYWILTPADLGVTD